MGVGFASGDDRAEKAAIQAINSPLLDISINGAKGVLFAISTNDDLTMSEFQEAAKVITESIDKDARVIIGTISDDRIKKGEMKITVIATGFPTDAVKKTSLFSGQQMPKTEIQQVEKKEPAPMPTAMVQKPEVSSTESEVLDSDMNEEDWGAIPAFLRRNKK
jgi:cell division protein FtsZ